jgi:hypothetical protein
MTGDINISMLTQQPIRPICRDCNELPARPSGRTSRGFQRWHTLCSHCAKLKYARKAKAECCSNCGFVAVDPCQMCAVDGTTICQNCNALRLKEKRQQTELTVDATVSWDNLRL